MRKKFACLGFLYLQILSADTTVIVNDFTDNNFPLGSFSAGSGDLRGCLNYLNTVTDTTKNIQFQSSGQTIILNGALPPLAFADTDTSSTIINFNSTSNALTINGQNQYQAILAKQGAITVNKVNFQSCAALGGAGGSGGGGGGMGGGGAIFCDGADIILAEVTFTNCAARGGSGGAPATSAQQGGGGGGGMGSAGGAGGLGSGSAYGGAGGGGGLGGAPSSPGAGGGLGGDAAGDFSGGGGGGAGIMSLGGAGSSPGVFMKNGSGGGGGGVYALGGDGTTSGTGGNGATEGSNGAGGGGGTSDTVDAGGTGGGACSPTAGVMLGGSGGGQSICFGSLSREGGNGTDIAYGGGGGGGGVDNLQTGQDLTGGSGGEGAGGGGGGSSGLSSLCSSFGGSAGWGGGSGGAGGNNSFSIETIPTSGVGGGGGGGSGFINGSNGGLGGGGGGGGAIGGVSYFGGGSGGAFSDTSYNSTNSGVGGGWGNQGGGGGAGLGGAIFINSGTLTFFVDNNTTLFTGGIVEGGSGAGLGADGAASGSAICSLATGSIIIFSQDRAGSITNLTDTIADNSAYSISGAGYTSGSGAGVGVAFITTNSGGSLFVLADNNTYSGATTVTTSTLQISSDRSLGLPTALLNFSGGFSSGLRLTNDITDMQRPISATLGNSGAILSFDTNGYNLTTSSVITGHSGIKKTGAGTWALLGQSPNYTGQNGGGFTIDEGTVQLDGSLGSPISVGNTSNPNVLGILQGTGSVLSSKTVTVNSNGIFVPGDPNILGTFTITGSLDLEPGSSWQANLTPTASAQANVEGSIANTGSSANLFIYAEPGFYTQGASFIIAEAANIVDVPVFGTFGGYIAGSQDLGPVTVGYPGLTSIVLSFYAIPRALINLDLLSDNRNARHLAAYLNQFADDLVLAPIVFDLTELSQEDLSAALNSISPARNAISSFVMQNTMFGISSFLSNKMAQQRVMMRSFQMKAHEKLFEEDFSAKPAYGLFKQMDSSFFAEAKKPFSVETKSKELWGNFSFDEEETMVSVSDTKREMPYGSSQTWRQKSSRGALWVEGFGEFINQKDLYPNPSYEASTGGALAGGDYYGEENGFFSGALCYAKSFISQAHHAGSGEIDYYGALLYGTAYLGNGYIELGFASALNRCHNKRRVEFAEFNGPLFNETATSSYWGAQVVPHLALGWDINQDWMTFELFAAFDYNILFLPSFSEKGAFPLNMHQNKSSPRLFRAETGFHFYQLYHIPNGELVFRETLSYVHKTPFGIGDIEANIVGYPPGFTVNSFTDDQNLFAPGFELFYRSKTGVFTSFSYTGEFQWGSHQYISNNLLAKVGMYF